jgi:acyl carrier protein phosphodiesterase
MSRAFSTLAAILKLSQDMTDEELNRRFDELQGSMRDMQERTLESMRDMQTEILRGLERFARGNFARMHRLEVSDNDLNERLNALEERITAIETRPPYRQ